MNFNANVDIYIYCTFIEQEVLPPDFTMVLLLELSFWIIFAVGEMKLH